ncbi:MAG: YraN family protein [Bacteroidaceae bacterium]|nr:YraN family protein [Bacteroidaceae bacterium]
MSKASELGIIGEELAANTLVEKGFTLLHRNWNLHKGFELDIVAMKDNVVVFCEVKTRKSDILQKPEDAVNTRKIQHIIKAANFYIKYYHIDAVIRFDIISIVYKNDHEYKINHIENAFQITLTQIRSKW